MGSVEFFTEMSTARPRWRWASACHIVFCTSSKTPAAWRAAEAARLAAVVVARPGISRPPGKTPAAGLVPDPVAAGLAAAAPPAPGGADAAPGGRGRPAAS